MTPSFSYTPGLVVPILAILKVFLSRMRIVSIFFCLVFIVAFRGSRFFFSDSFVFWIELKGPAPPRAGDHSARLCFFSSRKLPTRVPLHHAPIFVLRRLLSFSHRTSPTDAWPPRNSYPMCPCSPSHARLFPASPGLYILAFPNHPVWWHTCPWRRSF